MLASAITVGSLMGMSYFRQGTPFAQNPAALQTSATTEHPSPEPVEPSKTLDALINTQSTDPYNTTPSSSQEAYRRQVLRAHLGSFGFPDELLMIFRHAERRNIEPALLMALRQSENGDAGMEYGIRPQGKMRQRYDQDTGYMFNNIFHTYERPIEKQIAWAAATFEKRKAEFDAFPPEKKKEYSDIIDYIGDSYAPINVKNDPKGRNRYWEYNVRYFYQKFTREMSHE